MAAVPVQQGAILARCTNPRDTSAVQENSCDITFELCHGSTNEPDNRPGFSL